MDSEILKNFRPISNLAFVSKLIEKCAISQVIDFAVKHCLLEPLQSAYKIYHSTETALLKVQNDILLSLDKGKAVVLVLLDLSAAFDTVDHEILLKRLQTHLGITGSAIEWFRSYLSDRKQTVTIQGSTSSKRNLRYGVPQGSVAGPFLFSVYTLPLGDIIRKYGVNFKIFADDNQLYIEFDFKDPYPSKELIEALISEIREWFAINFLKLNDSKTDMLVAYPRQKGPVSYPSIKVGEDLITPSESVRNLGVLFDSTMMLDSQIKSVTQSSFCTLRDMYKTRYCLMQDVAETMVHAFISTRLDYCNSLLIGLPKKQVSKLQAVQNTAARLVTYTGKYDHITPVLKELHWLPVDKRIVYKVLLITYKCLNGMAPLYLRDLLTLKPSRGLRSDNQQLLVVPKSNMVTYGDRAYSVAGPKLWNSLPPQIRMSPSLSCFKRNLKTLLFTQAYK